MGHFWGTKINKAHKHGYVAGQKNCKHEKLYLRHSSKTFKKNSH